MGFANGQALITLAEQEGQTTVEVEGDSQVGGPVARVGQRMMDSVAKMMLNRFFSALQQNV
jgi:carbon monoxide dehydrogenase subunit G